LIVVQSFQILALELVNGQWSMVNGN
jgi:hypothetical protein